MVVEDAAGNRIRIEAKSWRPEVLEERMFASLGGKMDVDEVFKAQGQFQKDMREMITRRQALEKPGSVKVVPDQVEWHFDGRITKKEMGKLISKLHSKIKNDKVFAQKLFGEAKPFKGMGPRRQKAEIAEHIEKYLADDLLAILKVQE